MYGRHHGSDEGYHASGRKGRHGHHSGFGWSGRHGMGGGDMLRAGRMLATGDLKLIALALIAEQPRHGYDIIKVLEEKTAGWYSPSPGTVYPTLTYLEEAGYVTGASEGAKKLYTITDEGRAHLDENRDFVDAVLERLAAAGEKIASMRRHFGGGDGDHMPRSIKGALEDLGEAVREALQRDREAVGRIVEIIGRTIAELRAPKPGG